MIISWKNIFCSKEVKLGLKSPISDGLFCLELQFSTLFYFFRQSWKFSSCHRRSKLKQSKWKKSRVFVYFRIFFHCFFWYVYLIYKRKRKLTRWKLREKKRNKIFLAFCVLRDDYHLFFFAFKSDSQVSLLNWKLKNYEQGKVRRKKVSQSSSPFTLVKNLLLIFFESLIILLFLLALHKIWRHAGGRVKSFCLRLMANLIQILIKITFLNFL